MWYISRTLYRLACVILYCTDYVTVKFSGPLSWFTLHHGGLHKGSLYPLTIAELYVSFKVFLSIVVPVRSQ